MSCLCVLKMLFQHPRVNWEPTVKEHPLLSTLTCFMWNLSVSVPGAPEGFLTPGQKCSCELGKVTLYSSRRQLRNCCVAHDAWEHRESSCLEFPGSLPRKDVLSAATDNGSHHLTPLLPLLESPTGIALSSCLHSPSPSSHSLCAVDTVLGIRGSLGVKLHIKGPRTKETAQSVRGGV